MGFISKSNNFDIGANRSAIYELVSSFIYHNFLAATKYVIFNVNYVVDSIDYFLKNWNLWCIFYMFAWLAQNCAYLDLSNQKISLRSNKDFPVLRFYELIAFNQDQVLSCQLYITDIHWINSMNIFSKLPTHSLFALYKYLQQPPNSLIVSKYTSLYQMGHS